MGFWEAVVFVVAIVVVGRVLSGGRWNKDLGRWERRSPDNPYVRGQTADELALLRQEIARLNARVQTLEKIAIDPARQLADDIDRLRDLPSAARGRGERPDG